MAISARARFPFLPSRIVAVVRRAMEQEARAFELPLIKLQVDPSDPRRRWIGLHGFASAADDTCFGLHHVYRARDLKRIRARRMPGFDGRQSHLANLSVRRQRMRHHNGKVDLRVSSVTLDLSRLKFATGQRRWFGVKVQKRCSRLRRVDCGISCGACVRRSTGRGRTVRAVAITVTSNCGVARNRRL